MPQLMKPRPPPTSDILRDMRLILPGDTPISSRGGWWGWPWTRGKSVDVPAPKPEEGWFARFFRGTGETVGGLFGGAIGAITRPLMPLLIMVAVIGVIAFMILGRVQR